MLRKEIREARIKTVEIMFSMASIVVALLGLFEVIFATTVSAITLLTFVSNVALYFGFFALASFSIYIIEYFRLSNPIIRAVHLVSTYFCFVFFAVILSATFVFGLLVNHILPMNSADKIWIWFSLLP